MWLILNITAVRPVSYTHLDVYKRQVLLFLSGLRAAGGDIVNNNSHLEMETLFTLLGNIILPVVAIIIAIWSSRQTSKDATRQIESIKQLEKKQIDLIGVQSKTAESIKRLTEIQIEAKLRQIEVEIQKNKLLGQQVREEWQEIENIRKPQ